MADQKISQLTEDTTPTDDDYVATVNDPGGTPASRKVKILNLRQVLSADPGSPADGTWWVVGSGTSPTRTIALRVREGGVTYTLASITR
jgi:hypothetical protein